MATRKTRGIDTSSLPSASDLIALSQRPSAAEGLTAASQGFTSGAELASKLADRRIQREQAILQMQETIRKAKEEALQRQREQNIAAELGRTTPAHTRVAANIGGQPVLAKETKSFTETEPVRLQTALASAEPLQTTKDILATGREEKKSDRDFAEAQKLSRQGFEQSAELERIKAGLRDKEGKGKVSALIQRQQFALAKTGGVLKEIQSIVRGTPAQPEAGILAKPSPMSQKKGLFGALAAGKQKTQELGRGFLGGDPNLLSYEQLRDTAGRSLYKDLSGDVGNIAQQEGQFAVQLIPTSKEAPAVREQKLQRLERLYENSRQAVAQLQTLALNSNWSDEQYTSAVKATVLGLMQSAATNPLSPSAVDPNQFVEP